MRNITDFYNTKSKTYAFSITNGSLYDKVLQLVGINKKILDVGCANGILDKELIKHNEVIGIEVSPIMAKNAEKIIKKVLVGNIEEMELPFAKQEFDCILLLDVLEHLFDPFQTLDKLKPFLKKDGTIIISLPNVANWEIRKELLFGNFTYTESGLLDRGHIRLFTNQSARKMFKNSGYNVVFSDSVISMPTFFHKISNRLPFLHIPDFLQKNFESLFAYQFIFLLKKRL